jgi:hypothetical protein
MSDPESASPKSYAAKCGKMGAILGPTILLLRPYPVFGFSPMALRSGLLAGSVLESMVGDSFDVVKSVVDKSRSNAISERESGRGEYNGSGGRGEVEWAALTTPAAGLMLSESVCRGGFARTRAG